MKYKVLKSTSKWRGLKKALLRPFYATSKQKKVYLILGCQRSGTTLLTNIVDRIVYSKVYGEFSVLSSSSPDKLRLNQLDNVVKKLDVIKAPLIVMKPLVESQKAEILLEKIPNSSIIWMYRKYKDVVLSNKKKFKSTAGFRNIEPFLQKHTNNWRSENASADTLKLIQSLMKENASDLDAGAMFWYARNVLFFEQRLESHRNVMLWSYEDFVERPSLHIASMLNGLNLPEPSNKTYNIISDSSVGRAEDIELKESVQAACDSLMEKLDRYKTIIS